MHNLLISFMIVSFACLLAGLIRPKVFAYLFRSDPGRKYIVIIFGSATLVFFGLHCTRTERNTEPVHEQPQPPMSLQETTTKPGQPDRWLFRSVDEFKERFNSFSKEHNVLFRIKSIDIVEGNVDNSFSYGLTNNIHLIGTLHKANNSIKEIMMVGQGNFRSGADLIVVMLAIIGSVNPELPIGERQKILKELKVLGGDDLLDLNEEVIYNGVKYWINNNGLSGVSFGASSA